ncbi:hypothetical protein FOA52_009189 [Chlamydomonas sp. UWO 241]|nr:hypothetical protein FOA52_009189 [Chlamydomonas sp. UWO 241]
MKPLRGCTGERPTKTSTKYAQKQDRSRPESTTARSDRREIFSEDRPGFAKALNQRPSWLKTTSIDDLKVKLGKVVVMIFVVKALEFLQHISVESPDDLIKASASIFMCSALLTVTGLSANTFASGKGKDKDHH